MQRRASILSIAILAACSAEGSRPSERERDVPDLESPSEAARRHGSFDAYYHRGLAELDRYALSQSRYGEPRAGEAVLMFVTEEFHEGRQVKYEGGDREDVIEVLKLIAYRSFTTGIYPYTVSTAIYDPVDPAKPSPIKAVGSVIEWCGSTYMQWNRGASGFRVESHSYFQDEGDRVAELPNVLIEDAFFTQIRRDPSALPSGTRDVVPGLHHIRFEHLPLRAYSAQLERDRAPEGVLEALAPAPRGRDVERYTVRYPELGRTLRIYFGREFPHEIFGWEEETARGGKTELTTARRTNAILDDYWNHNGADDGPYREALGFGGGAPAGLGISSVGSAPTGARGEP